MQQHLMKWPSIRLHESVGIITWVVVFVISMRLLENASPGIKADQPWIIACFVGYLLSFIGATRDFNGRIIRPVQALCFASQLGFAFAILLMLPLDFLPILTIIWAAVSLSFFSTKQAVFVTTLVVAIWFTIYGMVWEQRSAIYSAFLYYSFHIFALMMSLQTKRAENATAEAIKLNTELQATRELLAESSKVQERTRIARELHDLLGHHLTALNINLQVANHLVSANKPSDELKQPIEQSYLLAKLLLSDVREAVSTIKENQTIDLTKAIRLIGNSFPNFTIRLHNEELISGDIELLHDLLRCIQELVTNAVKHGNATEVVIECELVDESEQLASSNTNTQTKTKTQTKTRIKVTDNGYQLKNLGIANADAVVKKGNGLTGIQERLQRHGGRCTVNTINGQFVVVLEYQADQ